MAPPQTHAVTDVGIDIPAVVGDASTTSVPCRHPRTWLRDLIERSSPSSDDDPRSSLPAYSDPSLRGRALAVAPMVDQSDLPYRLLCRRYGSNVCFTPMIHARLFAEKPVYRSKFWNWGKAIWSDGGRIVGTPPEDRPLVAQFCGSDPDTLLSAARSLERYVDAVDLNCGCPQGIARRGKYGAFLLEKGDHLVGIVRHLSSNLSVPVTVKVRLLPTGLDDSLALYERLVDAGAAMLTVHGRNRHQKGSETGPPDWDAIRTVVERLGHRVPILANGGIGNLDDARRCLSYTGADGVMSSEAILEHPALFTETHTEATGGKRRDVGRVRIAREFLDLCRTYPPDDGGQGSGIKCARVHLHRYLHQELQSNPSIRDAVSDAQSIDALCAAVDDVEEIHKREGTRIEDEEQSWYMRHRALDEEGNNALMDKIARNTTVNQIELGDDAAGCFMNLFGAEDEDGAVYGVDDGDY